MNNLTPFDGHILDLNVEQEVNRITDFLRESILQTLHRRGAIVGISGGIDSSVVLALCVRALGPQRVVGILMPERESSPDSAILAQKLADQFGIATVVPSWRKNWQINLALQLFWKILRAPWMDQGATKGAMKQSGGSSLHMVRSGN